MQAEAFRPEFAHDFSRRGFAMTKVLGVGAATLAEYKKGRKAVKNGKQNPFDAVQ
jgi:hypothetical protein